MLIRVMFLLIASMLSLGCNGGPSDEEVSSVVAAAAKNSKGYNPLVGEVGTACGFSLGEITEISKVEVAERGSKTEDYWPVKVKLTGKCKSQAADCGPQKVQLCPPKIAEFTSPPVEFSLRRDGRGWTAEPANPAARPGDSNAYVAPSTPGGLPVIKVDPTKVTRIQVTVGSGLKVVLAKEGPSWVVSEPEKRPANAANVKSALESLASMQVTDRLATGSEHFEAYDLQAEKAVHVAVFEGTSATLDAYFGKSGTRGQVARLEGDENAYVIKGYSSFQFGREPSKWFDNVILKLTPAAVAEIELENAGGKLTFAKKGEAWTASPSWPTFDPAKVDDLLLPFGNLRAEGFADKGVDTGLDDAVKNGGEVRIKLTDGTVIKIRVGKVATDKARYALKEGDSTIYIIGEWPVGWVLADRTKFSK